MRIVSFLPSATETVCALRLEEQLVGVSADSDWPPDVVGRLPVLNRVSIDTSKLTTRLEDVRRRAAHLPRPRVFCMEWLDPPYTSGHWVPEMAELAGGRDELGTPGGPSRRVGWEHIVDYAPEVIILMACSLELERVAREFEVLCTFPGWAMLPAVRSGRVYAGHAHLFSRSGPRLVDGVEALARFLHPDVFDLPIPAGQALKLSDDGYRLEPYR